MKTVTIAQAKATFSACIKDSEREPVVVTRNGRPVAVMLPVLDDDDLERLMLAYSQKLKKILDGAQRRIQQGQGVPHTDFWRDVEDVSGNKKKITPRRKSA
jgi:prevent-host-death family protein